MAPTIEELRRKLGVGSKRTVLRYLKWLEDEGDIERWNGARGLRALRSESSNFQTRSVPVVGQVPAGPLILADTEHRWLGPDAEEDCSRWIRIFPTSGARKFNE